MQPLVVVVADVDAEHAPEVAPVEDQQPVQALGTHGADEALDDRFRLRYSHRGLDAPDALATEDLVEGAAVLAVAVADQEADASAKSRPRLRACWVTQAPLGFFVQPASQTRRLSFAMKKKT